MVFGLAKIKGSCHIAVTTPTRFVFVLLQLPDLFCELLELLAHIVEIGLEGFHFGCKLAHLRYYLSFSLHYSPPFCGFAPTSLIKDAVRTSLRMLFKS